MASTLSCTQTTLRCILEDCEGLWGRNQLMAATLAIFQSPASQEEAAGMLMTFLDNHQQQSEKLPIKTNGELALTEGNHEMIALVVD